MLESSRSTFKALGNKSLRKAQEASSLACAILCVLIGTFLAASIDWNSVKPLQGVRKGVLLAPMLDDRTSLEAALQALAIAESTHRSNRANASVDSLQRMAIRIELDGAIELSRPILELRLFRMGNPQFWQIDPNDPNSVPLPLDQINGSNRSASLVQLKPVSSTKTTIVGVFDTYAKWKPKAYVWDVGQLPKVDTNFERTGGALFGAFVLLSAFSFLIGVINKDITFVVFAGWLLTSLRVAAMNGGWDVFWLGAAPSEASHLIALRISLALYAFLTIALFTLVFPTEVKSLVDRLIISGLSIVYLCLAIVAPWMLHADFSMSFWALAALGLGYVLTKVTIAVLKRPTRVAIWYGLSWAAMILGLLTEIGYQADILEVVTKILNAQTGAMAAALMMGVALADRLKTEREARVAAQSREVLTLRRLRDYFRASPIGLFSANIDGSVTFRNPAFDEICETNQAVASISLYECLSLDKQSSSILFEGNGATVECVLKSKNSHKWVSVSTLLSNGQLEGQIQDISERRAAEATLTHLANHDSLTSLLNRRGIDTQLSNAIEQYSSSNPIALAQISVDRFKFVNDLYGHGVGDEVLKEVARRIQGAIRSSDFAGRLGDSFLVLLNNCDRENATLLCERLRQFVSNQKFEVRGVTLQLTASIGVVQLSTGIDSNVAVAAAAHAWTDAKISGRNKVVHLDATTGAIQDYLAELRLISKLSQIDLSEQLRLEFQPIVDLRGVGKPLCFEVLLRTKNPEDGNPSPFRFIQAAERNGRMSQVDSWVTTTALDWIKDNLPELGALGFCTINISGASINDSKFVENLRGILTSYDSILPLICFEITESIALSDIDATKRFVELVKGKGCKLALDDFGAGYTSFNYLKEIPADIIKIDGTFVRDIATNSANLSITKTIVDLTHQLGMQSVAEWAETPECIRSLELLGVDFAQGFYLARPMSPEDLLKYAKLDGILLTEA